MQWWWHTPNVIYRALCFAALTLPTIAACSGTSPSGDSGPETSGTGTSGATTDSGETSAEVTSEAGTVDTDDTDDDNGVDSCGGSVDGCTGPGCGTSDDPPSTVSIPITVRNDSASPRFLIPYSTYACNWALASIADSSGPLHWEDGNAYPRSCYGLCETWGCSDGPVPAIVLAPGAEWTFEWSGDYHQEIMPDQICQDEFDCLELDTVCEIRRRFTSPMVTVSVAYSDECPDLINGCDCADVCEITGYSLEIPPVAGEFSAEIPYGVDGGGVVVITD